MHPYIDALNDRLFQDGCIRLHDGPIPDAAPVIEGQIVAPTDSNISNLRKYYGGILDPIHASGRPMRVLEIGAGMGNLSYGLIRSYDPEFYVASEPFETLVPVLRRNLDQWGYAYPRGVAATFDANYPAVLPAGSVNVIIGNSVLHHITKWRECLDNAFALLDDDGVLIFGEPNHESWSVILVFCRSLLLSDALSQASANKISALIKGLEYRYRIKDNVSALDKLEDKHIFSFVELLDYAKSRGVSFALEKRSTDFRETLIEKLTPMMATPKDAETLQVFAAGLYSPSLDQTTLGHPFMVFSMRRRAKEKPSA